jgi:hypothetical protein
MKLLPQPRQHGGWPATGIFWQSVHHGLRGDHGIFSENT